MTGNYTKDDRRVKMPVHNDLEAYRALHKRISNERAIFACLLVLRDIAYSAKRPVVTQQEVP